ncbi:hypothetical protein CsSME_00020120 [Camellia sinensis var. sinensis]
MELINMTINLDCKGRIYPITVCEEQIVQEVKTNCKCNTQESDDEFVSSNVKGELQPREDSKHEDDDDDMADDKNADKDNFEEVANENLTVQGKGKGVVEVEGSWQVLSEVEETEVCMGKSTKGDMCMEDSLMRVDSMQLQVSN